MNEHCKERFTRSNLAATRGMSKIEADFENGNEYFLRHTVAATKKQIPALLQQA